MLDKYYLNSNTLPTIPVPHDCVVKEISFSNEFLILKFENDISSHDSIKNIKPNAVSLDIYIHLTNPDFDTCKHELTKMLAGEGYYFINNKKLLNLCKKRVEYINHYIGYKSIIIKLFCGGYYLLDIESDFIEYKWNEI